MAHILHIYNANFQHHFHSRAYMDCQTVATSEPPLLFLQWRKTHVLRARAPLPIHGVDSSRDFCCLSHMAMSVSSEAATDSFFMGCNHYREKKRPLCISISHMHFIKNQVTTSTAEQNSETSQEFFEKYLGSMKVKHCRYAATH